MTPAEWAAYMEGYSLRLDDQWRQTRMLYALQYNIATGRGKLPDELIPLESDPKPEVKEIPLDDKLRAAAKMKEDMKAGQKVTVQEMARLSHGQ